MPRKPDLSFAMKQLIWDAAASLGKDRTSAICREVGYQIRALRTADQHLEDATPDSRTVRRVIDEGIQKLPADVVVAKLPPHTWCLREDYEAIKELAENTRPHQDTERGTREDPAKSLRISLREIGGHTGDLEGHKGGELVAFTLGNCSDNILTVERMCLEVLSCRPYRQPGRITARVMPLRYEVKLSPDALGERVITEERFRYAGRAADDFDLVCDSPSGYKYDARLSIHYGDLATGECFTLSSAAFDLHFPKQGDLLAHYRPKGFHQDVPPSSPRSRRNSTGDAGL